MYSNRSIKPNVKASSLVLILLALTAGSVAQAKGIACGDPKHDASKYPYNTLEVWQDCADLTWHIRANRGKFQGTVYISEPAVLYEDGVTKAGGADKLTLVNGELKSLINFDIKVGLPKTTKEFSFAVPLYARIVLVLKKGDTVSVQYEDVLDNSGIINLTNQNEHSPHLTALVK